MRYLLMFWGSCLLASGCTSSCSLSSRAKPASSPRARASSGLSVAVASRSKPGRRVRSRPAPRTHGFTEADYRRHIQTLRKKLPAGTDFTMVVEPPFVVVGDESARMVRQRAVHTVRWAVEHLKRLYFPKDPHHIITVWLFKDRASYQKYTWQLYRDRPGTPFGYYSETHRALLMNISTGGGTLVHEIVHPFMAANFPQCPAWFNEGMGSLYEQCGEHNGMIVGYTNWRLAGLQRAIQAGQLPSFKKMMYTTSIQFYDKDPGTNYAQARYLCYYLQQKGKLVEFYRTFHKNVRHDPSGYKTLRTVLGNPDMKTFQQQWERWVRTLRF